MAQSYAGEISHQYSSGINNGSVKNIQKLPVFVKQIKQVTRDYICYKSLTVIALWVKVKPYYSGS